MKKFVQTQMFSEPDPSFFNTIDLHGNQLSSADKKATWQNKRVLDIYTNHGGRLTPFECWSVYNSKFPEVPLTSIRRSITVLTKRGFLEKLTDKKMGKYGQPEHQWTVKEKAPVETGAACDDI